MLELGYAIHTLGWRHIIMFFDNAVYKPEDLPFDIRQHVPICFNGGKLDKILRDISKVKDKSFIDLYTNQQDISYIITKVVENFKPIDSVIVREMQYRIDSIFLALIQPFSDILYCLDNSYYGIEHLLALDETKIDELFERVKGCRFKNISTPYERFCIKDGDNYTMYIDQIINRLTSSSLYDSNWISILIKLKHSFIMRSNPINLKFCNVSNYNIKDYYKKNAIILTEITKLWLDKTGRENFENISCITPDSNYLYLNFTDKDRRSYLYETEMDKFIQYQFENEKESIQEQMEYEEEERKKQDAYEADIKLKELLSDYKNISEENLDELEYRYKYIGENRIYLGEFFRGVKIKDAEGKFLYKMD